MRIREGDPLEIYTDREGEVIFKKYSPVGELNAFAAEYAETLHKTGELNVIITDRDTVIAGAGIPKRDYTDKKLSDELGEIISSRALYVRKPDEERKFAVSGETPDAPGNYYISTAMPILSEGDVLGCVAALAPVQAENAPTGHFYTANEKSADEHQKSIEVKLIQTAAAFLGRQIEP